MSMVDTANNRFAIAPGISECPTIRLKFTICWSQIISIMSKIKSCPNYNPPQYLKNTIKKKLDDLITKNEFHITYNRQV